MIRKTKDGYVTEVFMNQQRRTNDERFNLNNNANGGDGGHRSGTRTKFRKHSNSKGNTNGLHHFSTSTAASHGMIPSKKFRKQIALTAAVINSDDEDDGNHQSWSIMGSFSQSPCKRRVANGCERSSTNYLTDCVFFLQDLCTKGSDCEFRHNEVAKTNGRTCKFWMKDTCHMLECVYRHPSRNTPVCTFYMQGTCSKGASCTFLHTGGAIPPLPASVPSASTQKITIQFEQDDDLLHEHDDVVPASAAAAAAAANTLQLTATATSATVAAVTTMEDFLSEIGSLDSSPPSKLGVKRARESPTNEGPCVSTAADILRTNKKARPSSLDTLSGTSQEVSRTSTATVDFDQKMAYIDQLLADE